MKRTLMMSVYAVLITGLGVANVHVAFANRVPSDEASEHLNAESEHVVWWKNYHWHKSTIHAYIQGGSNNREAVRAINNWTGPTDIRIRSSTTHTDISVLRGNYGSTGWLGLASIKSVARDSHCSNGYCEIRHCHAALNTSYSRTFWRREGTYSMEMGHCFGLDHDTDNGSMNSAAMNAGTSNKPSAGNVRAINGRY